MQSQIEQARTTLDLTVDFSFGDKLKWWILYKENYTPLNLLTQKSGRRPYKVEF